jgi:Tfp pilus assembly protein PilF
MNDAFAEPVSCPLTPEFYSNLAAQYGDRGDYPLALACLRFALELDPQCLPALLNYGYIHLESGQYAIALRAFLQCLRGDHASPRALHFLALSYRGLGDREQALTCFNAALLQDPCNLPALIDRGRLFLELRRAHDARSSFQAAVDAQPDEHRAWMGLSLTAFYLDHWSEGFEHYEHRLFFDGLLPVQPHALLWDGEAIDHLLLVAEQGLGDTLMSLRFLPLLRDRVAHLTFAVPHALLSFVSQFPGIDHAIALDQVSSTCTRTWLPCLSLPHRLRIQTPSAHAFPQIRPEPDRVAAWQSLLRSDLDPSTLLIGVHWQGNPVFERNHLEGRSLPLEYLAPLARTDGVQCVSLQKGFGSEQLDCCSFLDRFVEVQARVNGILDFCECSAIMACCDLIVTSDSAVVHLAGLLQIPTWLLLHYAPDWRWGLNDSVSRLYPSVRLFRQSHPGDWNGVLDTILRELSLVFGLPQSSEQATFS